MEYVAGKKNLLNAGLVLLGAALAGISSGCGQISTVDTGTSSNSTGTSGSTGSSGSTGATGPTGAGTGTAMTVTVPSNPNYAFKVHNATDVTDFTTPCSIEQGATNPNNDIFCIVEGMEFDLYLNGASLNFNIPPKMCPYTVLTSYAYDVAPPGTGPSAVQYDVDQFGTIGLDPTNTGTIPTGPPTSVGLINVTNVTAPYSGTQAASLVNGQIQCEFNYAGDWTGAPNCCAGNYGLTIRTWDKTDGIYKTATTSVSWGGATSNCLAGPAISSPGLDGSGLPQALTTPTYANGAKITYAIESPRAKGLLNNFYIANYYSGVLPTAMASAITFDSNAGAPYLPYYMIECQDDAEDSIARIRVQIRKWNTAAQFALNGLGNPNVTGNEPPPFGTDPNDDRYAWFDVLSFPSLFPGGYLIGNQ